MKGWPSAAAPTRYHILGPLWVLS